MTIHDVLAECPKDKGYQRTDQLAWFVGRSSPIDDEKRILAQRMSSVFQGVPDVWVAVPEIILPNAGLHRTEPAAGSGTVGGLVGSSSE